MSQTFKKIVGKDILFDFLEKICDKNDKFYTTSKYYNCVTFQQK